jgi:membrane protein implicated in regulation of membrane protease activity
MPERVSSKTEPESRRHAPAGLAILVIVSFIVGLLRVLKRGAKFTSSGSGPSAVDAAAASEALFWLWFWIAIPLIAIMSALLWHYYRRRRELPSTDHPATSSLPVTEGRAEANSKRDNLQADR